MRHTLSPVYIAGVGMTPTGKFLDRDIKQLTATAVQAALADAGLSISDIQSAYFSNATQGALDVMCTSVQMKKGRLGTLITLLTDDAHAPALERLLLSGCDGGSGQAGFGSEVVAVDHAVMLA